MISGYGRLLFEKDYSLYTSKQWGISSEEVDVSVLKRVPLRFSYDEGYFDDTYQIMPKHSYTRFFENLLDHRNITVKLGVEALNHIRVSEDGESILIDGQKATVPVVYTGALDELFRADSGALPYRSLRFEWRHEDNTQSIQPYPVTAYPQRDGYTRITEYNKLPVQQTKGTTYAIEYPLQYVPGEKQEPYYPLLTERSQSAAAKYKRRADKIRDFYYCGRLADFKYYNMDQALERALDVAASII